VHRFICEQAVRLREIDCDATARLIFGTGDMSKQRDGLAAFFVLVFGYTWGVAILYALFPGVVGTVSSSVTNASQSMYSNPLLISAVSSPTLAALIVASFLGRASIVDLIRRLLDWHIAWHWYIAATTGIASLALVVRIVGSERRSSGRVVGNA
jgi:hypothetical protein